MPMDFMYHARLLQKEQFFSREIPRIPGWARRFQELLQSVERSLAELSPQGLANVGGPGSGWGLEWCVGKKEILFHTFSFQILRAGISSSE